MATRHMEGIIFEGVLESTIIDEEVCIDTVIREGGYVVSEVAEDMNSPGFVYLTEA